MAHYIPKGYGFNVGQDFTRANEDLLLQGEIVRAGCWVYANIAGDKQHPCGFMRPNVVRVKVRNDCVREIDNA